MKKDYRVPEVEFIIFNGDSRFIVACSDDCSSCYYLECEPSDCYVASPKVNGAGFTEGS